MCGVCYYSDLFVMGFFEWEKEIMEKEREGDMYGILVFMFSSMDLCLRFLCEKGGSCR